MAAQNQKSLAELFATLVAVGIIMGIFIVLISLGIKAIFFQEINDQRQGTQLQPTVSCPPEYQVYVELTKNPDNLVNLIDEKKSMFAANGKFVNPQIVITKSETVTSKIRCGYLYVSAGTNKGSLTLTWEDVVIIPDNHGGHLVPDNAIWVNEGALSSQYLYSLDNIKYWDTHFRKNIISSDWASLLNVSSEILFEIKLNTLNRSGFIDKVSIAYKCWNPITGSENHNCKLRVTSKEDIITSEPVK